MYQIALIKNSYSIAVKEAPITHKFIKNQVLENLKKYECTEHNNTYIYTFANKISFIVAANEDISINKLDKYKFNKYNGIELIDEAVTYGCYHNKDYYDNDLEHENNNQDKVFADALNKFPDRHSLKESKRRALKLNRARIFFSQRGFYLQDSYDDRLDRLLLLFILALSYNYYNEYMIDELNELSKNNQLRKMIAIRDQFLKYNLFVYYNNPVKQHNYEVYEIWNNISDVYNVHTIHNEVKSQLSELVDIIQASKSTLFTYVLTGVGIFFAFIQILQAIK